MITNIKCSVYFNGDKLLPETHFNFIITKNDDSKHSLIRFILIDNLYIYNSCGILYIWHFEISRKREILHIKIYCTITIYRASHQNCYRPFEVNVLKELMVFLSITFWPGQASLTAKCWGTFDLLLEKFQFYQNGKCVIQSLHRNCKIQLCRWIHWVNMKWIFVRTNFKCNTAFCTGCPGLLYMDENKKCYQYWKSSPQIVINPTISGHICVFSFPWI